MVFSSQKEESEDLSGPEKSDAVLRNRVTELESLFANAPVGFAFFDREHRYVSINQHLADINGIPIAEHIGRPISEVTPVNARIVEPILDEVFRTGQTIERQIEGETPKLPGVVRHWITGFFPVFTGDSQPYSVGACVVEATDRIATEEALRESEERFRTLADNISPFAWMADATGSLFWYNQRWYDYTGTTFEEMQGWGWQKVHHPDHLQRVLEKFKSHVQAGKAWEDTFPLLGKDGNYRWFLSRAMPIRDEQGKVVRWFGTNTDITEQRDAEEALRESEERLRAFVSASSDVVYRVNADWTEMRQLSGRGFVSTTHEPAKDWIQGYIHPDDQPRVLNAIKNALQTKGLFELEHRVVRVDGSLGWTLSRAVPLLNADGEITEWFGAASDVTARKRAEDALIRSEKLASVGRMASTIAHEINNPLAAVMNLLFLAQHHRNCPPEVREDLTKAEAELKRVSHITRQVLGFYRDSSRPETVSLSAVLEEALALFEAKVAAKGVEIRKDYRHPVRLHTVAGEVRQVFSNLIANSLDAVSDGGTLTLRVDYHHHSGTRFARVAIADNGKGIEPAVFPRIFEPLFTTKESFGTGLGLWVSKQLVEKHGGSIRFRSSTAPAHRGTMFVVLFPSSSSDAAS